jgi:4-amino-4-deoxy-L-arabinose transferase-like glycosyltransferase
MNPASGWFTPTRTFMAGMALYFLLHSLIRVSFSDSLELDEAEQWVFAQWLDWGYSSQPPLYTWLLKALFSILGESIFTTTLLKNLCLYALYVATFGLARRVLGDEQRAVLAALSLLLMPPIAWEASRDLTHTVLVACWVPVSLLVVIGLLERPSTRGYLAWGLVTGLGLLSKYNFSLHLAALAVSLLTLAEGRRVLYDRRLLLTLWLAALVYAPQGLWLLEHHAELARGLGKLGVARTQVSLLPGRLIVAIAAYVAPLLVIVALIGGVRLPRFRPECADHCRNPFAGTLCCNNRADFAGGNRVHRGRASQDTLAVSLHGVVSGLVVFPHSAGLPDPSPGQVPRRMQRGSRQHHSAAHAAQDSGSSLDPETYGS